MRPKPVCTSSATHSAPCAVHHDARPAIHPGSGTTNPPSPAIGSTNTHATDAGSTTDSIHSSVSSRRPVPRNGYENGARYTSGANGPNDFLYDTLAVSVRPSSVRPWNAWSNAITAGRPVAARAIFTAFSTASAPEFTSIDRFSNDPGVNAFSASHTSTYPAYGVTWKQVCRKCAACDATASTTAGCACPTLLTAMPAPRSISRLPSTSSTMPPDADATKIGKVVATPSGTAALRRSHNARERGPGISVRSERRCSIAHTYCNRHTGATPERVRDCANAHGRRCTARDHARRRVRMQQRRQPRGHREEARARSGRHRRRLRRPSARVPRGHDAEARPGSAAQRARALRARRARSGLHLRPERGDTGRVHEHVRTDRHVHRHDRLRHAVPDQPLVRLRRQAAARDARRDRQALSHIQVLVHRADAEGCRRQQVLLVREPPDHLPHDRIPRRQRLPRRHVHERRSHRQGARRVREAADPQLARREGALRFHRMALRRLLPEGHHAAAHARRVRARRRNREPGGHGARPLPGRHRAPLAERYVRRHARPLVHEGQERRDRRRHVQPLEAAVRRHDTALHRRRRPRRDALRGGPRSTRCRR